MSYPIPILVSYCEIISSEYLVVGSSTSWEFSGSESSLSPFCDMASTVGCTESMFSVQPTFDAMSQNGDNDDSEPENSQLELDLILVS